MRKGSPTARKGPQGQDGDVGSLPRGRAVSHPSCSRGARGGSAPAAPGGGSGPGSAPGSPWRPRRVPPGLARSARALRSRPSPGTGQPPVPPLKAAAGAAVPARDVPGQSKNHPSAFPRANGFNRLWERDFLPLNKGLGVGKGPSPGSARPGEWDRKRLLKICKRC